MFAGMYARLIVIGLIVAAVAGGWWYVSNLQDENEELRTAKTVLEAKIADQNAGIEALKREGAERLAAAQVEIEAAQAATVVAKKKATIIYKTPPSTPGDNCKSALDIVNGVQ